MDEIRALSATGMVGSGFLEESLKRAMEWEPHFIAADAGTTDGGPDALATGRSSFPRTAVKRDLRLILQAGRAADIPVIIGSAGSAGGDLNVEWTVEIVEELAREEELQFNLAVIRSEQEPEYLKTKFRDGKITPLNPAPHLDEDVIDGSLHIVGMMGHEPIARALEHGAEVIVGGRASDTTLFAAMPLMQGFPEAPVWHAAKILECGAASVALRKSPDCMFARIREDHFVVEPPAEELWCTPQSVASHTLYENADPFHLYESSGMLDTTDSTYEAVSDRAVKVSNSRWVPSDRYTVKLEGVELAGYQSIVIGAIRDPIIIGQLDDWLGRMKERLALRIRDAFDGLEMDEDYSVFFRVYGRDGVMGSLEPVTTPAHEVCLFIEVTAADEHLAGELADTAHHLALHFPVPEWHGLISALAFPYSPAVLHRGATYRFNMNHVVEPADPYEMFPIEMATV